VTELSKTVTELTADRDRWKQEAFEAEMECESRTIDCIRWKARAEALEHAIRNKTVCSCCLYDKCSVGEEPCHECLNKPGRLQWVIDEARFMEEERKREVSP
jgi:hypothetical protein